MSENLQVNYSEEKIRKRKKTKRGRKKIKRIKIRF